MGRVGWVGVSLYLPACLLINRLSHTCNEIGDSWDDIATIVGYPILFLCMCVYTLLICY